MSYRTALVRRWSRRDVLAVLVVAASVAFLTGAGLVGTAATAELAGVAAEFEPPATVTAYDDVSRARGAAGDEDVVLPLARATTDGEPVTVVGVPAAATGFANGSELSLPAPPASGELRGPQATDGQVELAGTAGTVSTTVSAREGGDALPDRWYVASPETVTDLGPTGALVLSPEEGATPLVGVLAFFLRGSRQVLRALGLATLGAGVLLGVTVFATTRMTVRDRLRTVRVARATGATPRSLLALFGARAGLQTAVGVAGGYALGVVAPNAAVNAAVFLGQPTSLSLRVTPDLVGVLVPSYVALVGVGAAGGVLAALPAVRQDPASLDGLAATTGGGRFVPGPLRTEVLDWRAVVPTAATLGVFLVLAVLVASTAAVVGPLAGGDGATITQQGAPHPFASTVPERYATELRVGGAEASPEILALGVTDGDPYVARGANYSAFAGVTDATVVEGRAPGPPGETIVGVDLARTLGLSVGDSVLVGGSTRPAVDRLTVVGTYRAPEPYDDQMVVPLSTARALSGKPAGQVQFVRTDDVPAASAGADVAVVDRSVPGTVPAGGTLSVSVTLLNPTAERRSATVRAALDGAVNETTVDLAPNERRTVELRFEAGEPRVATVEVAGRERTVEVVDPRALRVTGVPAVAPTDSEPLVRVVRADGTPVEGATVRVGGGTVTTDAEGQVRLPLADAGQYEVTASDGDRTANASVTVRSGTERTFDASVAVAPDQPTPATEPTVTVTLSNPWNRTLSAPVAVDGPGTDVRRTVELGPGAETTVSVRLPRRPAGEYEVRVASGGATLGSATYEVAGDPRLSAALATSGRSGPSTGIGEALSVVLGNLELVVGVVLGLAGLMTVGGTTAGFASAVHARRRSLGVHRATGATPGQVLALVLGDAARIALVATTVGLALAAGTLVVLDAAGLLVVYGVRVLSMVDPAVVAGALLTAFGLAMVGATLAAVGVVETPPSALLAGGQRSSKQGGESRE